MAFKIKYHNKELSWLSFNHRVLQEAQDRSNPLFERIKFLSIYDSNLQEFCRNKLGPIKRLNHLNSEEPNGGNRNTTKILKKVRDTINHQYQEAQDTFYKDLLPELSKENIHFLSEKSLQSLDCMKEIHAFFRIKLLSHLQPVLLSGNRNKDLFLDNVPYFFLKLKKENTTYYGIVNIPNNRVSRLYKVQCLSGYNLTLIDEIIRMNLVYLFQGYFVEEVVSFRVIRNELFDIQDEYSGVLKDKIKEKLQDANKKNPTSVIYDEKISDESLLFLKNYFRFKEKDLLPGSRYHDLKDLSQLKNPFGEKLELQKPAKLTYEPFNKYECIFKKIKQQDHLLYFPYHSYDHVLRFFNESSVDAQVSEIRVTLYRLATNSAIISALINAAKNGKKVLVFIEIKAREDEAHNIYWAEEMEKAGVTVVYSIPELKVHAKMALIYRNEPEGIKHYSFLCTGNFNEQTANFYTDFGFFTSKRKINDGIVKVFENIYRKIPLSDMGDLLVTKYNFKRKFKKLINNEIINKIQGKPAKIILKLNNLEESEMIDMLYDAANAGVEVILIIRSICCFNIGHPKSENLKLIRLVDIHLEHARVVYFHNNGKEIIYLSSADWMQRNIYNRVEIAFPLKSKKAKKLVKSVLDLQIADNQKAVTVDHALNNLKIKPTNGKLIRAQYATYDLLNQFLH